MPAYNSQKSITSGIRVPAYRWAGVFPLKSSTWSTIKSRSAKLWFYEVYWNMWTLNIGVPGLWFYSGAVWKRLEWLWLGMPSMCIGCWIRFNQKNNENTNKWKNIQEKLENHCHFGTRFGTGTIRLYLGALQTWIFHFGVLLCVTIWKRVRMIVGV